MLQLTDDVRTAMTYRNISHNDLTLFEIYKHPEFDGYFNALFENSLPENTRLLFRSRQFPFASLLRYFFNASQFFPSVRFKLRHPIISRRETLHYTHSIHHIRHFFLHAT